MPGAAIPGLVQQLQHSRPQMSRYWRPCPASLCPGSLTNPKGSALWPLFPTPRGHAGAPRRLRGADRPPGKRRCCYKPPPFTGGRC